MDRFFAEKNETIHVLGPRLWFQISISLHTLGVPFFHDNGIGSKTDHGTVVAATAVAVVVAKVVAVEEEPVPSIRQFA